MSCKGLAALRLGVMQIELKSDLAQLAVRQILKKAVTSVYDHHTQSLLVSVSMSLIAWEIAGLIGAGTNNARLAGLLRNLSSYYYKEHHLLFLVRVAQGLVHMGKGLLTIAPSHSDNFILSGTGSIHAKTLCCGRKL